MFRLAENMKRQKYQKFFLENVLKFDHSRTHALWNSFKPIIIISL